MLYQMHNSTPVCIGILLGLNKNLSVDLERILEAVQFYPLLFLSDI